MKKILYITCTFVALQAAAQTKQKHDKVNLSKNYSDDGKTMHVKISGTINGKSIEFDRKYNLKGLSAAQKDSVKKHIIDSLAIN
jgi:spore coat protein CotH